MLNFIVYYLQVIYRFNANLDPKTLLFYTFCMFKFSSKVERAVGCRSFTFFDYFVNQTTQRDKNITSNLK